MFLHDIVKQMTIEEAQRSATNPTAPTVEDSKPVHKIGLVVTDPNHPMVSKRGDTIQKTVRVLGNDRQKAINAAIAHYRRKGFKVHDHHYLGLAGDLEEGWKGKLAGLAMAAGAGAGAVGYHDATKDVVYKGYEFQHAPANVKVPGIARLVNIDGKQLLMWKDPNPDAEGKPVFLYKNKAEADVANALDETEVDEVFGFQTTQPAAKKSTSTLAQMRKEFEKDAPAPQPRVVQNKDADEVRAREVHVRQADEAAKNSHGHTRKQQAAIAMAKQGVAEGKINPAGLNHTQQIGDYVYRAKALTGSDEGEIEMTAYDGKKSIADTVFMPYGSGGRMISGQTYVHPAYRGKGVAAGMYAYLRMLGFKIEPSGIRTGAGKAMWDKWGKAGDAKHLSKGVAEGREQDYLSQIPNLSWKPVSRSVWNTIQDEGLDEEQDAPKHTDWIMASLTISPEDSQALQAFDSDAIEDFNRFDIHLKSRHPGLTDLIDYDNGTVTIVKPSQMQGVAEGYDQTFAGKDPMSFKSPNNGTPTMMIATSQGSRYLITSDGMVLRNKSFHANTGGEDQGLKNWSDAIEFYDPTERPGGTTFPLTVAKAVEKRLPVTLSKTKDGKRALLIHDGSQWRVAKISDVYKHVATTDEPIVSTYSTTPKLNWNVLDYTMNSNKTLKSVHPGSPVTHGIRLGQQGVAEGEGGLGQVAGIGFNGKQFNFSIKDIIAKAQNYPIKKLNPQLFVKQLADRHEDPKQTAARAQAADLQYPIIVVQDGNTLMIADGTHRAQKAIMNKLPSINAYVIPVEDMAEFSKQGLAKEELNELDMFAPVTTFIKMTDGSYVQADWRRGQFNAGLEDSASFINFKPVNPTVAKQLGLDSHQRTNAVRSMSDYRNGTIAHGGDYQRSGPLATRGYEVVDYNKPESMEELPPEVKPALIKWVQKQGQGVAEGKVINTYLWHGSRQKIPVLEPRQAVDTGGAAGSNQNAIYATSDPIFATQMGMPAAGSDYGHFPNDPQMVLFSGKIRKGEYVYLHKLPFKGPDGKPQFVQGGNSREFHSIPGVEGIKPIEIKEIPVNKYLNLIRKATPADLKLRKKYMKKQGVAEDAENFNGIDISLEIQKDDEYVDDEDYDNQVLYVTASSKGKELGHVLFAFDGEYLMPQDLEVEERYRGQGIAQIMYDYVKSKGYKIRRSGQQTDAGAGFWDKHKPGKNVWEQGVAEGLTGLSIQQLATISDEALDNAYHYGRSQPGNTFGWQANLASAAYAKQMIDRGETDVEAISDAVHKGWWSVAQKFVDNPDQFDDTATLRAKGKFDKKMADRIAQMVPFNQLTKDQQDIDTVVARAMLQAIKGQQGVAEGKADYNFDIEDLKRLERIRDLPTLKTQAMALISKPSVKPMKPEKVEWFKNALDNQRMNSPMKVIKLMYDLLLSGEGNAVVGTRSSMNPNSYRQRFGEQGVAEDSWHGAGNDAKDAWHGAGDAWSGSGSDGGSAGGGIPVMGETTGKPLIRPVKYERADGSIEVTYELLAADGRTIKTGMSKEIAMSLLKHYRANHVSESIEQQRLAAMRRAGYFD